MYLAFQLMEDQAGRLYPPIWPINLDGELLVSKFGETVAPAANVFHVESHSLLLWCRRDGKWMPLPTGHLRDQYPHVLPSPILELLLNLHTTKIVFQLTTNKISESEIFWEKK